MKPEYLVLFGFLGGVLIGTAVCDMTMAFRIYKLFPNQKPRHWPGAGLWMSWKSLHLMQSFRDRLITIHSLLSLFPMATAHWDDFRACLSKCKKISDIAPKSMRE